MKNRRWVWLCAYVVPLAALVFCFWFTSKIRVRQEAFTKENNAPIVFYGRLEDQSGSALENTAVNFSVHIFSANDDTTKRSQVISDTNGLFTISGYTGESLEVVPEKTGYVLASTNRGGIYSRLWPEEQRMHPDRNNPVVIRMWKLQGAEPLARINQRYKLRYTNAPINFDLIAGKIVPSGGDLRITVHRPGGLVSGLTHPDWSVQIEAVEGGLIRTSAAEAAITYAAPKSGYEPSTAFIYSANDPRKWSEFFKQAFFVMSRNGQMYSKLGLIFGVNENPDGFMSITFGGIANTNGSRNWEGDPDTAKAIGQ